jgi:FtsP/CotA-like multicopper oxidase with cupredoxin domain
MSFKRAFHVFAALLLLSGAAVSHAADRSHTLFITPGTLAINGAGGATLNVWGYTDVSGANPMVPGPVLEAEEGDSVTVTVYNQHSQSHNFVVRNLTTDATSIPAGGSRTYTFTTATAGVYLYHDTLDNNVNREMGLHGALVVRAAGGVKRAWTNGPTFDAERLWVVTEMDKPRWNDVAAAGQTVNTSVYRPNYFLMNGQGGFDAMHDPNSVLEVTTGETGLIRIVNAGQFDHSLHFHGAHFEIIDMDGGRLTDAEPGDTINMKPGTTAMLRYTQPAGIYPMHIHSAQMETANGVYLNGVATLLVGN